MLAKVGKSDDEAIFTEARGIDGDAQAAVIPALAPERGGSTIAVIQRATSNPEPVKTVFALARVLQ